jgi:class 3 adenylate cyclase/predicted ATPase
MSTNWFSFLPFEFRFTFQRQYVAGQLPKPERIEAVALFADVSGFTAMSEALAKTGKAGSEELTSILNSYFEPMIETIESFGGSIVKFGGDAMTVLFHEGAEVVLETIHRALTCAEIMQGRMWQYQNLKTEAGVFSLQMKIGLAFGKALLFLAGNPEAEAGGRLEYIVAGSALDLCAEAEHLAERGEIVVHNHLLEKIAELLERPYPELFENLKPRGEEYSQISGYSIQAAPQLLPTLVPEPDMEPLISHFLPESISQRIRLDQQAFVNEHRKVTVMFASFTNFDYDHDPTAAETLRLFISDVIRTVHRFGGYFNKVDMGDKGSKFIVLFGAPVANENDEDRALNCALTLLSEAYMYVSSLRIGISTGNVYCGLVGSASRMEYTVMGDAVNLAARLMQAAQPAQVLVSYATRRKASSRFGWEELSTLKVRGKSAPVKVYQLLDAGQGSSGLLDPSARDYALPMVGRREEFAIAIEKLEAAIQGRGQVLGVSAEAGMGKSRLSAEIIRHALTIGFTGYSGECISYSGNMPYQVWQNLLRAMFGVNADWPQERQIRQLTSQLAMVNPALVQRIPLMGAVLNITIPENFLTRAMTPELRKTSLESMLVEYIRSQALKSPLLVVLEDLHWIDPLSDDLLETLVRNTGDVPLMLLLLYRPPEALLVNQQEKTSTARKTSRFEAYPDFQEIFLSDFSTEEATTLITLKLNQLWGLAETVVPSELVEALNQKAQGNPFYIDELINLMRDRELDPADTASFTTLELPESLSALILSRIDRLSENEKTTLKIASVIGRLFKASWLWGVSPDIGQPDQILNWLSRLSDLELTPLDRPEPELEYLFKHILTREVTYESLALSTRAILHEQFGNLIERSYDDRLGQYFDILAHHYGRSRNYGKQREYFSKAGDAARQVYANSAALEYYRRLLPLLSDSEQPALYLKIGQVLALISNFSEAQEMFRQGLSLALNTGLKPEQAALLLELGELFLKQNLALEGERSLSESVVLFRETGNAGGVCRALAGQGEVQRLLGNYTAARNFYNDSLSLADRLEVETRRFELRARTLKALGTLEFRQGNYQVARTSFEEGLELLRRLNDKPGVASMLNNLAIVATVSGDMAAAEKLWLESLQLQNELGDRFGAAALLNNLGVNAQERGDTVTARRYLEESLKNWRSVGDRWSIANVLSSLGDLALEQNDLSSARAFLFESLSLNRQLGDNLALAYLLEYFAGLVGAEGRAELAIKLYNAAGIQRQALNAPRTPSEQAQLDKRLAVSRQALATSAISTIEKIDTENSPDELFGEVTEFYRL